MVVTVFRTVEHVRAWHDDVEHRAVQQWGRDRVFERYDIKTCEVVRTLRFPEASG